MLEIPCCPQRALVYLAGPYTAKDSVTKARNLGRLYAYNFYLSRAHNVLCMPLSTAELEFSPEHQELTHQDWINRCLDWISISQVVAVTPDWQHSTGVQMEIEFAKSIEIPIHYLPKLDKARLTYLSNWMANQTTITHPYWQCFSHYFDLEMGYA